jgi:hypothetical protein
MSTTSRLIAESEANLEKKEIFKKKKGLKIGSGGRI